jgi:hypothetical protein
LELLIEELYVDESLDDLLGEHPHALPTSRYAEAIAAALILRHSWRADDLTWILERLGLKRGALVGRRNAARSPGTARRRT